MWRKTKLWEVRCDLSCTYVPMPEWSCCLNLGPSVVSFVCVQGMGLCKSHFSFTSRLPVRLCQLEGALIEGAGGWLEVWRSKKGRISSCLFPALSQWLFLTPAARVCSNSNRWFQFIVLVTVLDLVSLWSRRDTIPVSERPVLSCVAPALRSHSSF